MNRNRDEGFAAYFASRSSPLRGTAFLLCGDWHRAEDRGFFHREEPTAEHTDRSQPEQGSVEDRMVLLRALVEVPPRQRAVLVLRFWEDLSVEDTTKVLRCSAGNVKSQTARGLAALRDAIPATTF